MSFEIEVAVFSNIVIGHGVDYRISCVFCLMLGHLEKIVVVMQLSAEEYKPLPGKRDHPAVSSQQNAQL